MKVIIDNRSGWRTADLRRFTTALLSAEGLGSSLRYHVVFKRGNRGHQTGFGGLGWLHRRLMHISMPDEAYLRAFGPELSEDKRTDLARVILHEADHNRGLGHRDMVDHRRRAIPAGFDPARFPVRWQPQPAKAQKAPRRERLAISGDNFRSFWYCPDCGFNKGVKAITKRFRSVAAGRTAHVAPDGNLCFQRLRRVDF